MDRKNLGILFLGGHNWVGGLYYILNIIRSLDYLSDEEKPNLVVFYGNNITKSHLDQLDYPYLTKVDYGKNLFFKLYYRSIAILTGMDKRIANYCKQYNLDTLYPYNYPYKVKTDTKIVAWFPDFQHKFLPQFFDQKEIQARNGYLDQIQSTIEHLVFSSNDAISHYNQFYTNSKIKTYTLPFISNVDGSNLPSAETVKKKYEISGEYYIISNQFWEHKNHHVVLNAAKILKDKNIDFTFIFTGKQEDHRNPDYFPNILQKIKELGVEDYLKILGFISREDQLSLMKASKAVIQPSKFEGWGTVVEDAKTLGVQVFASDIGVHHEQLENNAYYFGTDDPQALAELVEKHLSNEIQNKFDYKSLEERRSIFIKKFLEIMN